MIQKTTVKGVSSRTANRKSDGRPFTIFEIEDAAGTKWQTFRKDLAEEANRLIGQPVEIQGSSTQNANGFTNNNLEDITAGSFGTAQGIPEGNGNYGATPPIQDSSSQSVPDKQKQLFIMRQTAAKVAATISPTATEFWANCDSLVGYFISGEKPNVIGSTITAAIPEQEPQPFVAEDDIPF